MESWQGWNYVVGFTLDLSTCIDHADEGEDVLEYFNDFISNAIA
jgi:hypothetical protein